MDARTAGFDRLGFVDAGDYGQGKLRGHARTQNKTVLIDEREAREAVGATRRREPDEGHRLTLANADPQRVRPHLGNRRVLHPVDLQKILAAFLYRDQIEAPSKILREDMTDLGSRRIMYPLHCQIGASAD